MGTSGSGARMWKDLARKDQEARVGNRHAEDQFAGSRLLWRAIRKANPNPRMKKMSIL